MPMRYQIPAAAVHDLVIHSRDDHLVVATHGRSIYVADVAHLQALDSATLMKTLHSYSLTPIIYDKDWGNKPDYFWTETWQEKHVPKHTIPFYTSKAGKASMKNNARPVTIKDLFF